ncbi:RNA polymerase sigma factor ShbA [Actinokineospora bangkokensis]|nr:RNA polymerase sigma factor ShbA [Actinokineospora bangkokensis]
MSAESPVGGPRAHQHTYDDDFDVVLVGLIDRDRAGDTTALTRLVELVRPHVVRYARNRLGVGSTAQSSAEDVAQEVCLALLGALPGYRRETRPVMAFVHGIAAHKIADVHRARGRDRSDPVWEISDSVDTAPGPEQVALQNELGDTARKLIAVLPLAQQEILRLRLMVGLSAEETAARMGSTAGAIRVAQHRALAALRRSLRDGRAARLGLEPVRQRRGSGRAEAGGRTSQSAR